MLGRNLCFKALERKLLISEHTGQAYMGFKQSAACTAVDQPEKFVAQSCPHTVAESTK